MASAFQHYLKSSVSLFIKRYNSNQARSRTRYSGYINKLIEDEKIGHAVRNDQPEQEYFFTYNDLIIDEESKQNFRSEISVKTYQKNVYLIISTTFW